MAATSSSRAVDNTRKVFLNVPYEAEYEEIFIAFLSTIVCLGREPIIVAEVPDEGGGRLPRIFDELSNCRVSIHEMGWIKDGEPRFNMPFELGIAWALRKTNPRTRHHIIVFEEKSFRLNRTLSDWSGSDPKIHGGSAEKAIGGLLDALARKNVELTVEKVMEIYRKGCLLAKEIKKENHSEDLYSARAFRNLVGSLILIAESEGYLQQRA